jgi:hypothetical protein
MMFSIFKRQPKPEMVTVYFTPLPNITAYDLADMLSRMVLTLPLRYGVSIPKDTYDTMPLRHRRHWSLIPPDSSL